MSFNVIIHQPLTRFVSIAWWRPLFYLAQIPNDFSCLYIPKMPTKSISSLNDTASLRRNLTIIISCTNPIGGRSNSLIDVAATVDAILVTLTFLELIYIARLARNDPFFMIDQEFCTVPCMI